MYIFQKTIPLPLSVEQSTIKHNLLQTKLFAVKESWGTIILSRHRSIPTTIPRISKILWLLIPRVTTSVLIENSGIYCKFAINREAVLGFLIIIGGWGSYIAMVWWWIPPEDTINPLVISALTCVYGFFLVYELYTNYHLIHDIVMPTNKVA